MQDLDIGKATKVIDIMRRVMRCMGTWPEEKLIGELTFIFTSTYLIIHCFLALIDVSINTSDITYAVAVGMEIVFNMLSLFKIIICRIKRKSLIRFVEDIKEDFITEKYKTKEEKLAFLSYNNFSQKIVTMILMSAVLTTFFYYFMSLAINIEMGLRNSSYGFKLPYKVWLFIDPTNIITYICLCCYQFYIVPCLIFGYVGTDCFFISLVLHVSGLFSALSCKVKHVLNDPCNRQRRMKKLIMRHIRLIRLSECLEDDFNLMILLQLVGSTFQFCLVAYDALVSSVDGEGRMLFTFCLIVFCVFIIILTYCYIGECLIRESSLLGDAFYHCEWYNISRAELKLMHICMMRSTKQMRLTSGKFCTLSLNTFSDVLKTSMAYFSVLRSFL